MREHFEQHVFRKKNPWMRKKSKLEIIEISDKTTNPRCRSQVWQHFHFKVTYKVNGLRFKSSTEFICQTSFHRKQETEDKKKSVEVCNCNRMLLSAPTYDMTKSAKKKSLKQILKIGRGSGWI